MSVARAKAIFAAGTPCVSWRRGGCRGGLPTICSCYQCSAVAEDARPVAAPMMRETPGIQLLPTRRRRVQDQRSERENGDLLSVGQNEVRSIECGNCRKLRILASRFLGQFWVVIARGERGSGLPFRAGREPPSAKSEGGLLGQSGKVSQFRPPIFPKKTAFFRG